MNLEHQIKILFTRQLNSSLVACIVDFSEVTEVDTVAGVLKQWLRELPDPLFPFAIHDDLINAYSTCFTPILYSHIMHLQYFCCIFE